MTNHKIHKGRKRWSKVIDPLFKEDHRGYMSKEQHETAYANKEDGKICGLLQDRMMKNKTDKDTDGPAKSEGRMGLHLLGLPGCCA